VNRRDYRAAYDMFLRPRTDYETFADGWSDTSELQGYFGGFQPYRGSAERGDVPGLLVGTSNTGAVTTVRGCYFMLATGGKWYIEEFTFKLLRESGPTSDEIDRISDFDCSDLRAAKGLD
jgi:hypothetical protein